MSNDENEEIGANFKMGADDDEPVDPEDMPDLPVGDDDDDPENRFH